MSFCDKENSFLKSNWFSIKDRDCLYGSLLESFTYLLVSIITSAIPLMLFRGNMELFLSSVGVTALCQCREFLVFCADKKNVSKKCWWKRIVLFVLSSLVIALISAEIISILNHVSGMPDNTFYVVVLILVCVPIFNSLVEVFYFLSKDYTKRYFQKYARFHIIDNRRYIKVSSSYTKKV